MSNGERKRPRLAPPARLPYALFLMSIWFGRPLMDWLGAERLPGFLLSLLASLAPMIVCAVLTFWLHRRWLVENGYTDPSVRRGLPPEIWIGLGVFVVGMSAPVVLGLGRKEGAVVGAVTIMAVTALVVLAAMKDPDRKAEDERRHREGWSDPFG
ncbi:MAG: hypothetical protein QNJ98_11035 [Planctomycetota bacterium]|nr:hypothetical protein [Planctomycetota bacterium]